MSVFVDVCRPCLRNANWPYERSCHLLADSIDELHAFATSMGLKRQWFQNGQQRYFPHYDLTVGMRKRAVAFGAIEITSWEMTRRVHERVRASALPGVMDEAMAEDRAIDAANGIGPEAEQDREQQEARESREH